MQVSWTLRNLIGVPAKGGQAFLNDWTKHLKSMTDSNVNLDENFLQLLILKVTNKQYLFSSFLSIRIPIDFDILRDLVTLEEHPMNLELLHWSVLARSLARINTDTYIIMGKGSEAFPCDLDTTLLELMVMKRNEEVVILPQLVLPNPGANVRSKTL